MTTQMSALIAARVSKHSAQGNRRMFAHMPADHFCTQFFAHTSFCLHTCLFLIHTQFLFWLARISVHISTHTSTRGRAHTITPACARAPILMYARVQTYNHMHEMHLRMNLHPHLHLHMRGTGMAYSSSWIPAGQCPDVRMPVNMSASNIVENASHIPQKRLHACKPALCRMQSCTPRGIA